jgi:hypothetical protein
MNIHQIQMQYDRLQDRILLRVSTSERAEFRFWVTRRYVKLLWTILIKMLEREPAAAVYADESVRRTMMGFQHTDAVRAGNFDRKYEEAASTLPLGDAPVLLSRVTAKQITGKHQLLCMHPEQGQGIDIAVDAALLHRISKLVIDAVGQAGWDLKFAMDPDMAMPLRAQGIPPHKLN